MLQFDSRSRRKARYWFGLLVAVNGVLIAVLIAGAIVSYSLGPFEGQQDSMGRKTLGGPHEPGRFVSKLPLVLRVAAFQLDADKEGNLAMVISAFNFLLLSFLAMMHAYLLRSRTRWAAIAWLLISLGLMLVGFEEIFSLHSYLDNAEGVARRLGEQPVSPEMEFALFIGPLILGGVVLLIVLLRSVAGSARTRLLGAGAVALWVVALLLDFFVHGMPSHMYRIAGLAEESMEIIGTLVLIYVIYSSLTVMAREDRQQKPDRIAK